MSEDGQRDEDRVILEATLQTALEAGVRVQMSGGYTARVYDTMDSLARALGAERVEGSVSSVVVGLTVHRAGWSRTAFQRTPHIGINFAELSALSQLTKLAPTMAPDEIRQRLADIEARQRKYPTALVMPMLGLATASFAALFGADAVGIVLSGLGGFAGAWVRHVLGGRHYKPFIFCLAAAFVSTSVVLLGGRWSGDPSTDAVAACVLYLVPGVPLLNGTADLLATHYLNGVVRLVMSLVIVLGSAVGVGLAFGLWGSLP
jgi:uncharacterized membrane protein YjjP (DUF1212 family)